MRDHPLHYDGGEQTLQDGRLAWLTSILNALSYYRGDYREAAAHRHAEPRGGTGKEAHYLITKLPRIWQASR